MDGREAQLAEASVPESMQMANVTLKNIMKIYPQTENENKKKKKKKDEP